MSGLGEGIESCSEFDETREALDMLKGEILAVQKEDFKAKEALKHEMKRLGFYDGDENGENINFNINNVREYLEGLKNKTWTELDVKSSELEKGVRTIAIQIAINYINMEDGKTINIIKWIDGIRGSQTWRGVKEFQIKYGLENKDGLPGRETIRKILELLGSKTIDNQSDNIRNNTPDIEVPEKRGKFSRNIDDSKCFGLFRNFRINQKYNGDNAENQDDDEFINKLTTRIGDMGELEGILLNNPEVQNLLVGILHSHGQNIQIKKDTYHRKKHSRIMHDSQYTDNGEISKEETIQKLEDYEYDNFSRESFEEFIISDEGIAIIIDEIKSHIDTNHKNTSGEYDKFCETYPFSVDNLEIKLRNAWESKIQWDYYIKYGYYNEKKEQFDAISNQITGYVDKIVEDYMKSGKQNFNRDIRGNLESLLSKGSNGLSINDILSEEDDKDIFKVILGKKIKNYKNRVYDGNDVNLNTSDIQINLQLKSYLYVYGSVFYSDCGFKSNQDSGYYEEILPDVMKIILGEDDESLINKIRNRELAIASEQLNKEREERDMKRRIRLARIKAERNSRTEPTKKTEIQSDPIELGTKYLDPNNATGPEIAAKANLNLNEYNLSIEESKSKYRKGWEKETIFNEARKGFIQENGILKSMITQVEMRRLFDINNNIIDDSEWQKFKELDPILKEKSLEEIEKISSILSGFSSYFNRAQEKLSKNSSEMEVKVNETVKTYAIGNVIDNIRNAFPFIPPKENGELKGFQLKINEPIKQIGDDIIILGSFNDSKVTVRYNLKNGDLFMNSFLNVLGPNKINISNKSSIERPESINHYIGNIGRFDLLLNNCYELPPVLPKNTNAYNEQFAGKKPGRFPNEHQEGPHNMNKEYGKNDPVVGGASMPQQKPQVNEKDIGYRKDEAHKVLESQISLIDEIMEEKMKNCSEKNSAIIKFLKTFNIIYDSGDIDNLDFNKTSNIFDVIQILNNSNYSSLMYFNNEFMKEVMEYSGLKRGENNKEQDKENEKSKKIFSSRNKESENENRDYLQNVANNFNPEQFSSRDDNDFDDNDQLRVANLIKKVSKFDEPIRELDECEMEKFIEGLKKEEYKQSDKGADTKT